MAPNIVFIMADDLGYADLSCYGQLDYATPNLDRLAARGVRFTRGYASSSVCSATRVALMTGRYQYRLKVGLEEPLGRNSPPDAGLPPEHPTLPSLLRDLGYRTTLVGKWHVGFEPDFGPLKSGYESFFGITAGGADYFNHGPESASPLVDNGVPVSEVGYLTDILGRVATERIHEYAQGDQPFLISLHFTAPHWPWEGPNDQAVSEKLKGREISHYDGGTQRTYGEMVERLDSVIGDVLAALDAEGIADDTIVVFTSDNGGERFSKNWPFTGMKTELLEGGLRVPMLFTWPASVPPAVNTDQAVVTMDWLPTLLAAAGGEAHPDYPFDGENLLPVLRGEESAHPRKLFWRYKFAMQRAVLDGDWKYLKIGSNDFLFDVVKDPRERANLRKEFPEVYERLKEEYRQWNETMLPESSAPVGFYNSARRLADHFGATSDLRVEVDN